MEEIKHFLVMGHTPQDRLGNISLIEDEETMEDDETMTFVNIHVLAHATNERNENLHCVTIEVPGIDRYETCLLTSKEIQIKFYGSIIMDDCRLLYPTKEFDDSEFIEDEKEFLKECRKTERKKWRQKQLKKLTSFLNI